MAMIEAREESNAAEGGADHKPTEGEPFKVGFSEVPYPKTMAARHNSDIPSVSDSIGSMGNDGTSAGAYKEQPRDFNSKDPKIKD